MIKSSGFNGLSGAGEQCCTGTRRVLDACVIGVPDEAQVERVKRWWC